jgi:hypothetical protein
MKSPTEMVPEVIAETVRVVVLMPPVNTADAVAPIKL